MNKAMNAKRLGLDLTEGPIPQLLITFALPIILTNIVQQVYSVVDLMIIGKFVGSVGTVGVSTGGELSDVMTPLASAFATAGQIYIAQLAGEKDHERIKAAASTLITLMMELSLVFTVGTFLFHNQILTLLNCPEEAFSQATAYMMITAAGMPFIFGYNAVCALLRGIGESTRPLIFILIAATANIFADILLVVIFPLEAAGTAIATVLSQVGAFSAAFAFMYKRREQFGFKVSLSYFKIDMQVLRIILCFGIPQLVRTFAVQFSMLWVKANINDFGLVVSATYSIGNKIEKFMNVFVGAVDGAGGAMVGQNIGARKIDRVKKTVFAELTMCLIIASCVAALFLFFPRQLFRIFIDDQEVIEYGVVFLRIMIIGCFTAGYACCFKSLATGCGAASLCLANGILDGVCRVVICIIFISITSMGAASYFWGAALCQLIPGMMCMFYFLSGRWQRKKLLSES